MNFMINPLSTRYVDRLQVRVYPNRKQLGAAAGLEVANKIKELQQQQSRVRMVFAAAPSQNEFLATLAGVQGIDWSRITVFHMDEYIGLAADAPQRFAQYLRDHLFDLVKPGVVHVIDSTQPIDIECERYTHLLKEAPIDIVCLGIGENGHLAFNDPPVADFADPYWMKPVELEEKCRMQQVNDGCFSDLSTVPTYAITMTIPALLTGNSLYCIVPGRNKQEAVRRTLQGPIITACPATILRTHPHCVLYLDNDSFGGSHD